MIEIEGISKSFGSLKALDSVSFSIRNGEVVGYVGLNGAGKTTTIRICVGVLNPDSGDVKINGYSVTSDKRRASRCIGWVPELPIFELDEKALNYFVYLAGYYGIPSSEARSLGRKLFEELGLERALNMKLKNFSQGMKKRFALAVSMINNPDNFLFDEVLNGLDPQGIAFFRDLTKKFKSENRAVLFSSHILKEVEGIADRVVFIHKGRIVKIMSIDDIKGMTKPRLILKIANIDKNASDLLKSYGDVVGLSQDRSIIHLENLTKSASEIVEELVRKGYKVEESKKEEASLEEVFFKVIGEHQ